MAAIEIGLAARARGLATHLVSREALASLAEADDLGTFVRGLSRLGAAIDPIGEPPDVFAVERAVGRTASRHLRTLYRWQERTPGVLDMFAARQDRHSLRALLRGAVQGAPPAARLEGLLPTPTLPQLALAELARQPSPAAVVQQLLLLSHPDAPRLLTVVRQAQVDLLAVDTALLLGFADRATRVADGGDEPLRQFVGALIDTGNAQNALVLAGEPVEGDRARLFVRGGRWLSASTFLSIAAAGSQQRAWAALRTAVANSPLASWLPIAAGGADHVDRLVLGAALEQLGRAARVEPMSSAPVLRVLLLIEAQTRDLRALAWGAALGAPPSLRRQELVTPT